MPERRSAHRLVAALAATVALGLTVLAPAVLAQEAPTVSNPAQWSESKMDAPFTGAVVTVSDKSFPISGTFIKTANNAAERIVRVRVMFEGDGEETTPTTAPPEFQCIPTDPEPSVTRAAPDANNKIVAPFAVSADVSVWPCNGTYTVRADALSNQETIEYVLSKTLRVAVPPDPARGLQATVAGGENAPDPATGATADDPASVLVTWDKLVDPDTQYPDFIGYRVQRAGPAAEAKFDTVSEVIGQGGAGEFTDTIEAPGEYRYRVQSLRTGPDGPGTPVPSTDSATPVVPVSVAGPPTPETTTTAPGANDATTASRRTFGLPKVNRPTTTKRSTPGPTTTIDDGFNDTLDYGDLSEPGSELAGEGQSIIQNEGEGAGLVGPVAGAMVLLGWAGHVAYLNRLAKQF